MDHVTAYANAIRSGEVVTSKKVATVYMRLADEIAAGGPWRFDERKADKAVRFCERFIRQSKSPWAGKPLKLLLWQKALISALFGFVDDNGLRRYRELYLLTSRKCGKSTLTAAIAIYVLFSERGGEVYITSTKLDQSMHFYDECDAMISQSPVLSKRAKRRRSDIYLPATRSTLRPLASKSSSLDSLNSSLVVADEIHAWRGESGRKLYNVLRESMSTREEPLFITTTTCGYERGGVFDDLYSLAEGVIDGTIDQPRFLPVIYELDHEDEWLEDPKEGEAFPAVFMKANPSLGEFKRADDLMDRVMRARQTGDCRNLLVKDFNVRMGSTAAWLTYDELANRDTFEPGQMRGRYGIAGVDLSSSGDLTSAGVLVPDEGEGWLWLTMSWLPEDLLEAHERRDDVPYSQWVRRGLVRTCPGNRIRLADVTKWLLEVRDTYGVSIMWCGYDPWSSAYWVDDARRTGMQLEQVIQGARTLSNPMKDLAQALKAHEVNFNANPLVMWALSNVQVETDRNENIVPTKERPQMRIDPAMALLDAWVVLQRHHNELVRMNGRYDRVQEGMG